MRNAVRSTNLVTEAARTIGKPERGLAQAAACHLGAGSGEL
jgi:hypothetical protein